MRKLAANADEDFRTSKNERLKLNVVEHIQVGGPVWLSTQHDGDDHKVKGKLDVDWMGPHFVVQKASSRSFDSYVLEHVETMRKTKPIHRRFVRKATLRPIQVNQGVQLRKKESTAKIDEEDEPLTHEIRRSSRTPKPILKTFSCHHQLG